MAIAQYLIERHGFTMLELRKASALDEEDAEDGPQAYRSKIRMIPEGARSFSDATSLLAFVTSAWDGRWVTTELGDTRALDLFVGRPFFLFVSVDAPVGLRYRRFADR